MSRSHKNNELWLISYADLMTLLFGFFALLYTLSEDEVKSIQIDDMTHQNSSSSLAKESFDAAKVQQLLNCQADNRELRVENKELKERSLADSANKTSDSENDESIRKAEFSTPCRLCVEFARFNTPSDFERLLGYPEQPGLLLTHVKKAVRRIFKALKSSISSSKSLDTIQIFKSKMWFFLSLNHLPNCLYGCFAMVNLSLKK